MELRRSHHLHRIDPQARERALDALARSRREGVSLTHAAKLAGTTPRTVHRYAGQAFRRDGRRYRPRPFDRLERRLSILTPDGPVWIGVRDSRTASHLAQYHNDVKHYLWTGDDRRLLRWRGKTFMVGGVRNTYLTDLDLIDDLALGGELEYQVYATVE